MGSSNALTAKDGFTLTQAPEEGGNVAEDNGGLTPLGDTDLD
jgi:hypothetical protein